MSAHESTLEQKSSLCSHQIGNPLFCSVLFKGLSSHLLLVQPLAMEERAVHVCGHNTFKSPRAAVPTHLQFQRFLPYMRQPAVGFTSRPWGGKTHRHRQCFFLTMDCSSEVGLIKISPEMGHSSLAISFQQPAKILAGQSRPYLDPTGYLQ